MKLKLVPLTGGELAAINPEHVVEVEKASGKREDSTIVLSTGAELRSTTPFDDLVKAFADPES